MSVGRGPGCRPRCRWPMGQRTRRNDWTPRRGSTDNPVGPGAVGIGPGRVTTFVTESHAPTPESDLPASELPPSRQRITLAIEARCRRLGGPAGLAGRAHVGRPERRTSWTNSGIHDASGPSIRRPTRRVRRRPRSRRPGCQRAGACAGQHDDRRIVTSFCSIENIERTGPLASAPAKDYGAAASAAPASVPASAVAPCVRHRAPA